MAARMTADQELLFVRVATAIGPGIADYYRDACHLLNSIEENIEINARSHLVASLMRECLSALQEVAASLISADSSFPRAIIPAGRIDAEADNLARQFGVETSESFRQRIRDALSAALGELRNREDIRTICQMLLVDQPIAGTWLRLAKGLGRLVHRDGLRSPRPIDDEFLASWGEFQVVLAAVVDRVEATSLVLFNRIEEIVASNRPHEERLALINRNVPRSAATLRHLFSRIDGPEWLAPLQRHGYFSPVPRVAVTAEGRAYYPPYEPGRFLVRVAADAPTDVVGVLQALDVGDNDLVRSDLLEAAAQLPPDHLASAVGMILGWIRGARTLFDVEPVVNIVVRLVSSDYAGEAHDIAAALLEVDRPPAHDPTAVPPGPAVAVRLRNYQYGRALEELVPHLLAAEPLRTVKTLASLLTRAVGAPVLKQRQDFFDGSPIWLHRVDTGQAAPDRDLKVTLAIALRDNVRTAVEEHPNLLQPVFDELVSAEVCVAHRIGLDLLAHNLPHSVPLAESQLRERDQYADPCLAREFSDLFVKALPLLSNDARTEILTQLDSRALVDRWVRGFERVNGRPPLSQEIDAARDRRVRDWYALAGEHVPSELRSKLAELVRTVGPPESVELVGEVQVGWGSESPITVEEAASMDAEALLGFLVQWEPAADALPFGPSVYGLFQTIRMLVSKRPAHFDDHAAQLEKLEPTYVRAVLQGWREAPSAETSVRLFSESVLGLCRFVAQQPSDPDEVQSLDRDRGWRWAKSTALDLVREVLLRSGFDRNQRETVWSVISQIADDLNPSPEFEARCGGRGRQAVSLSLNSTRGKALHAAFAYYLWVLRLEEWSTAVAPGLTLVPEFRQYLLRRLDPTVEESVAVRAAIGMYLPLLLETDREWFLDTLPVLFPSNPESSSLTVATWDGYLSQNTAPIEAIEVLGPQFAAAIECLPGLEEQEGHDPLRLFQHLFFSFARNPSSERARQLLLRFFEVAAQKTRYLATTIVGHYLDTADGEIDARVIEALKQLWTERIVPDARGSGSLDQLMGFGAWFASGRFDGEWALSQLATVLELAGAVDDGHRVVARLSDSIALNPVLVISCLEKALLSQQEMVHRYPFQMGARPVIEAALTSESADARRQAKELINRLAARGDLSFRDLLD